MPRRSIAARPQGRESSDRNNVPVRASQNPGLHVSPIAGSAAVRERPGSTPDRAWFCLWEGYGWAGLPAPGHGPPALCREHRDRLLFAGAVRAAAAFRSGPWFQSPTLWWPDDRAWVVTTELDISSTYVARSRDCLAGLIADPRLDVVAGEVHQRIDPSPYPPCDSL